MSIRQTATGLRIEWESKSVGLAVGVIACQRTLVVFRSVGLGVSRYLLEVLPVSIRQLTEELGQRPLRRVYLPADPHVEERNTLLRPPDAESTTTPPPQGRGRDLSGTETRCLR
jgi:hypothetical protein